MNITKFQGELVDNNRIIYTPSFFAKASLLHLQEIGTSQAQKLHTSKRESLTSFLFFVVDSGSGTLQYDGMVYPLCSGDCVFINCSHPYSHQTSAHLWSIRWIHFHGPSMNSIYEKYVERGGLPTFHPHFPEKVSELWQSLYQLAASEDYVRDMHINEALSSLLTLLMEESWHPELIPEGDKSSNLSHIKSYLDEHFTEKITLDQLSVLFYMDKFYLTKLFRRQFGLTITNYLLQKRITHAKHLLRFTTQTVESVGAACGMSDVHYFSRVFKKIEGISPSEYRKHW